jgi:tetratricopeptide (TPR) repeat protein
LAFCESSREESPKVTNISLLSVIFLVLWICIIIAILSVTRTDSSATFRLLRSQVIEDFASFFNDEGITYGERDQHQLAIEEFNKAIRRKPTFAEAYNNRGFSYSKIGQYQLAVEDYNKAISINLDYAYAFNNRGAIYFKQGNNKLGCLDAQKGCALGKCKVLEWAKGNGLCR